MFECHSGQMIWSSFTNVVDIPDAKCHWYVMSPDNTFGEGFSWEDAPWFDANGLNDVAPMQAKSVLEKLQDK